MSARTGRAKVRSTSPSATMLPSGPRLDTTIRFKQATKIARFLTCSGKSTIPSPNALGGDMESLDSIHFGGVESVSGGASTVLSPRTRSSTPTVTLMTRPTAETASSAEEHDPRDTDHGARGEVSEHEGTGVGKGPLGTQKQDSKQEQWWRD